MPEPAQAEGLIPKQLAMLCANEAVRGAAGAAPLPPRWPGPTAPRTARGNGGGSRGVRAGEAAASFWVDSVLPVRRTHTLSQCLWQGWPRAGLGVHVGWELWSLGTMNVPCPATLPATRQPCISKEPLHKHRGGGSSKAGASIAVENKSLNIWSMKFKLHAKAEINLS